MIILSWFDCVNPDFSNLSRGKLIREIGGKLQWSKFKENEFGSSYREVIINWETLRWIPLNQTPLFCNPVTIPAFQVLSRASHIITKDRRNFRAQLRKGLEKNFQWRSLMYKAARMIFLRKYQANNLNHLYGEGRKQPYLRTFCQSVFYFS